MATAPGPPSLNSDRLLAIAFLAITQAEIWVFSAGDGFGMAVRLAAALATAVASLALAWRRTRPLSSFAVNSAGVIAAIAVGYFSDFYQWTNLIATYSLAAHAPRRQAWAGLPFAIGGVVSYFLRFPAEGGLVVAGFAAAMWLIAWLAGQVYGSRMEQLRLAGERDRSLALAEVQEERLGIERERAQIARELHDVIGHGVNVMVIHAGAGRGAIDSDPDAARASFETIEEAGRRALGELDRVLAVLRRDEAPLELSPAPGVSQLPHLVEIYEAAGLNIELHLSGDQSQVPDSVALSAYRIIQEALTNVSKHSPDEWARVDVRSGGNSIELAVVSAPVELDVAEGRGLTGMRERAALHGARLEVLSTDRAFVVSTEIEWAVT